MREDERGRGGGGKKHVMIVRVCIYIYIRIRLIYMIIKHIKMIYMMRFVLSANGKSIKVDNNSFVY